MSSLKKQLIKFSIIITFKKQNENLFENLEYLNQQTFNNFEVILISENKVNINIKNYLFKIIILKTDEEYPGIKRHEATKHANGDYFTFIDDDAYPSKFWLEVIYSNIKKYNYLALGGPAIDIFNEKNIGTLFSFTYKCNYIGGFPERYMSIYPNKLVNDWPSVNFTVEKDLYNSSKGFNYNLWPGEDTLLCNELSAQTKIVYIHDAIVYHHRRQNIYKHFKQLIGYSKMRGAFFLKRIRNSSHIKFVMPTLLLIYSMILLTISFFNFENKFLIFLIIAIPAIIYLIINIYCSVNSIKNQKLKYKFIPIYIIINYINHLIYGIGFLKGLIKSAISNNYIKK